MIHPSRALRRASLAFALLLTPAGVLLPAEALAKPNARSAVTVPRSPPPPGPARPTDPKTIHGRRARRPTRGVSAKMLKANPTKTVTTTGAKSPSANPKPPPARPAPAAPKPKKP